MEQDVLAVASAELEFAQEMDELAGDTNNADFAGSVFAGADNFFLNFAFCLGDSFLNGGGIDAAVFHETFKGVAGDLAANGVKAREDDHTRGVINQNVNTGGALEGLDVAAFFTDNATLHIVVGEFQGGDGAISSNFRGHTLHGGKQHGLGGFVNLVAEFFLLLDDEVGEVLLDVALGHLHQFVAGGFLGEPGDLFQFGLLAVANVADFGLEVVKLFFLLGEPLGLLFKLV